MQGEKAPKCHFWLVRCTPFGKLMQGREARGLAQILTHKETGATAWQWVTGTFLKQPR